MMVGKKLVRDKVFDARYIRRVAEDSEYYSALIAKLQEEVDEFKENEDIEELADIIEVVYAISESKGTSVAELEHIRNEKALRKGKFKNKIMSDPK